MTRPAFAAGALVVIVAALGTALLLGGGPSSNIGGPSNSPSPSATAVPSRADGPTPTPTGAPVRAQLLHRWIGGGRNVPGIVAPAGASIIFRASSFEMSQSNGNSTPVLTLAASSVGSHTVRLVSSFDGAICGKGDTGLYDWSVTADGRTLTLTAQADTCANRPAALSGTWYLVGCRDTRTDCLGDVAAGTYESQYIAPRLKATDTWHPVYGAVTYTVPDGWANSSDWLGTFGLTPSSAYDVVADGGPEGSQSILLVAQARPESQKSNCSGNADTTVARTVAGEIAWLRHLRGVITTAPTPITVDGHPGQWLDLRLDPSWTTVCAGPGTEVDYLLPDTGLPIGVTGTGQRQRVIILDLGSGDLVAIVVNSDTTAPFAGFVAQAMPVVESLTFK